MADASTATTTELAIVGGGPAGMAAALIAGRAQLSTIVVNKEAPRNAVTTASHGFVTRDGIHPTEFLAVAKAQLQKYPSAKYLRDGVEEVEKASAGFRLRLSSGAQHVAKRLVIATGYRDDLSQLRLPGIEAVYGKSVYPCPFCDGFEHADERIAVFGDAGTEHFVPLVRIWSRDICVFTNGVALSDAAARELQAHAVPVFEQRVAELSSEQGQLRAVQLEGGPAIERDSGFVMTDFSVPSTLFAESLGVARKVGDWGMATLDADAAGKTQVPGLYVVGDAKSGFGGLTAAAGEGAACVEHIVHDIAAERWKEELADA